MIRYPDGSTNMDWATNIGIFFLKCGGGFIAGFAILVHNNTFIWLRWVWLVLSIIIGFLYLRYKIKEFDEEVCDHRLDSFRSWYEARNFSPYLIEQADLYENNKEYYDSIDDPEPAEPFLKSWPQMKELYGIYLKQKKEYNLIPFYYYIVWSYVGVNMGAFFTSWVVAIIMCCCEV